MVVKAVMIKKIEDSIRKGFEEIVRVVTRLEAIRLLRTALQ